MYICCAVEHLCKVYSWNNNTYVHVCMVFECSKADLDLPASVDVLLHLHCLLPALMTFWVWREVVVA